MRVILIVLLTGVCASIYGQNDKVYLQNGSIIKGTVSDTIITDSITVFIDQTPLGLPLSQVSEIVYGKRKNERRPEAFKNYAYARGHFFNITAGLIFGDHSENDNVKALPSIDLAYEYHHSHWLNLAMGAGFNAYDRYTFLPLYLQYQFVVGEKNKAIFVYARGGKSFLIKNKLDENTYEVSPGFYSGIGLGLQKKVGINFIRLQLGYQMQKVEEKESIYSHWSSPMPGGSHLVRDRAMKRIALGFAFVF